MIHRKYVPKEPKYKIPYLFDYKPSDFYTNQNWIELKFGL